MRTKKIALADRPITVAPARPLPEQRAWLLERIRERLEEWVAADVAARAEIAKQFTDPAPDANTRGTWSTTDLLSRGSLRGVAMIGHKAEIAREILPEWKDPEDAGKDLAARARQVSKRVQEQLLSCSFRPSSSCMFSNAVEVAKAEACSEFLRYGISSYLERVAEIDAEILTQAAAEYAGAGPAKSESAQEVAQ